MINEKVKNQLSLNKQIIKVSIIIFFIGSLIIGIGASGIKRTILNREYTISILTSTENITSVNKALKTKIIDEIPEKQSSKTLINKIFTINLTKNITTQIITNFYTRETKNLSFEILEHEIDALVESRTNFIEKSILKKIVQKVSPTTESTINNKIIKALKPLKEKKDRIQFLTNLAIIVSVVTSIFCVITLRLLEGSVVTVLYKIGPTLLLAGLLGFIGLNIFDKFILQDIDWNIELKMVVFDYFSRCSRSINYGYLICFTIGFFATISMVTTKLKKV